MPSDDILAIRRRKLLEDAGRETQGLFDAKGHRVSFSGGSRALDAAVRDYRNMREEYAQKHGIAGGLLAKHKVGYPEIGVE